MTQELKKWLERFNGQDVTIVSAGNGGFGCVLGLEHFMVMDYGKGIQMCNINNVLDENNPISVTVNREDVMAYEVVDCCENIEIHVCLRNNGKMVVIGV